jgi:SulP family sulfate permease
MAALAAVVAAAVLRLIELRRLRRLLSVRRSEFVVAVATTLGVVILGMLQGIVIALVLSILDFVRRATRPHDAVVGRIAGRRGTFDAARYDVVTADPAVLVYRFDASLFSGNAEGFRGRVRSLLEAHPDTRHLVVDASVIADVDATSGRMLGELADDLERSGVTIAFVEVLASVEDLLRRYGLTDRIRIHDTAEDAVREHRARDGDTRLSDALKVPGHSTHPGHGAAA